ncbi:hypothetical protein KC351_g14790 [Hortaea werneckii]|nr:hypothetical protein KC351_g14790 [Hortaea werneckii]
MSFRNIAQVGPKKKAGSRRQITAPTGKDTGSAAKARRIKTIGYPDEGSFPTHIDSLKKHVYNLIVDRMQRHSVSTANLTMELLEFMLPKGNPELWERLMSLPISVTDVEMLSILNLERSAESTPTPPAGSHIYYVRSFRLTIAELLKVIDSWERKRIWHGECLDWKTATKFIPDQNEEVYVRYVGMTATISAWDRYADDLARREGGIYGAWIEALGKRCQQLGEPGGRAWSSTSRGAWNGFYQSGIVTIYWEKEAGKKKVRVTLAGGRSTNVHPPKDATGIDAVRTIHFLPTGIDIRMHDGTSCTYTRFKRSITNPIFPGDVLRSKLTESGTAELKNLWELETNLNFDQTFLSDMAITGSSCTNCASIREMCGGQLPCPRCVRMGLTCVPQTLASAATGTPGATGKKSAGRPSSSARPSAGPSARSSSGSSAGRLSSSAAAISGQRPRRGNARPVIDDSSEDIYDLPTVEEEEVAEEEEDEEEEAISAPTQAKGKGKGKAKAKARGGAEIRALSALCQ